MEQTRIGGRCVILLCAEVTVSCDLHSAPSCVLAPALVEAGNELQHAADMDANTQSLQHVSVPEVDIV